MIETQSNTRYVIAADVCGMYTAKLPALISEVFPSSK